LGQSEHDRILSEICEILENRGFRTHRECEVFSDEDGRGLSVDVFASRNDHTLRIEFDAHRKIKKKSIKKLAMLNPTISMLIVGNGAIRDQGGQLKF